MTLEALLAALHLLAILTLVVFMSSQAALCRAEWLNAAVVERLARLDVICAVAGTALIATGVARLLWGIKGTSWYVSQPLFHVKMTLVLAMVVLAVWAGGAFRRWQRQLRATGALPAAAEVASARRKVMVGSHLLPLAALVAVFWTRGW